MVSERDPSEKKEDRDFISNGKQHHAQPIWKILATLLALPLGGAFMSGIFSYRAALSTVDERIENYRPLNQRLDKYGWEIDGLKKTSDEHNKQLQDITVYINSKGRR
jgi:hypothetical protein